MNYRENKAYSIPMGIKNAQKKVLNFAGFYSYTTKMLTLKQRNSTSREKFKQKILKPDLLWFLQSMLILL